MNALDGIKNFLQFINENWTTICVIIGLCIGLYQKIKSYMKKSKEEKIAIAKEQCKQTIMKLVHDAEIDYSDWKKAGSVKRSQVITEVYSEYPILSKVVNQEALTAWIDAQIDSSLENIKTVTEKI